MGLWMRSPEIFKENVLAWCVGDKEGRCKEGNTQKGSWALQFFYAWWAICCLLTPFVPNMHRFITVLAP